ncbi:CBS domain-containing protein [Pseudomonas lopnurensis]|uniref:CBS domain-containing protein n=1 Tax=Pseudomonas lopnurensis TaxID=1477517 RepID=UPI0018790B1D|nr:CBS domain-containing protein [Pseudomonas lopnurensis]MBE7375623.1 CBS domain-containing protein [Pseudomonas lopnurensis]
MKTVAQVISTKQMQGLVVIAPEDSVLDALKLMAEKNVGALPVADGSGRLVGIVSERDYARKMVLKGRSSFATPVSAIMTTTVITVEPRQTVRECMQIMTEKHLRHLPVIDEGRTVGLLSIGDVVKETMAEQDSLIQQLKQYIRGE